MDLLSVNAENLFSYINQQQYNLENLASQSLSRGIDLYMEKNYKEAAKEFKRAVGLSFNSSLSADASNYLAMTYLKLSDTKKAIETYKNSINLNPQRDDIHITLGNLYYSMERYVDAEKEYEQAVKLNPSSDNQVALGMAYINTGRYTEAETIFNKLLRMEPQRPDGNYGLGLIYSKKGEYASAISQFLNAIDIQDGFYDAYAELGYAYADSGDMEKAQELVNFLEDNSAELADTLSRYMYKVDPPKMLYAYSGESTFLYKLGKKTPVALLDSYLINPSTSKYFTMVFQFDKEMDKSSVENRLSWEITRSYRSGPGQAYNFNEAIPSTEAEIEKYPINVFYDTDTLTATVKFEVSQNTSSDATIDPSHIEFKFTGKDKYGLSMNSSYDQFIGFSGVV
jgi:tetratricopeptide (TPR) repeat protein